MRSAVGVQDRRYALERLTAEYERLADATSTLTAYWVARRADLMECERSPEADALSQGASLPPSRAEDRV
jgi:hypothetical protein